MLALLLKVFEKYSRQMKDNKSIISIWKIILLLETNNLIWTQVNSNLNIYHYIYIYIYVCGKHFTYQANIYIYIYVCVCVCLATLKSFDTIKQSLCKWQYIYIYIYIYTPIGLVGRVFDNGSGDWGSILGWVIPKTQRMVLDASLLNAQHYLVGIKGKLEQSRKKSSALLYTSVL